MAVKITDKQRKEAEAVIYQVFDALDPTKSNSEHYKAIFAKMSNEEFVKFASLDFPYRFHHRPFEIEPSMDHIKKAADIIKVPLLEKVNLPYLYTDKNGVAVNTKECIVGYNINKKVQQFITKKNSMSTDISQRDMKTGLLTGHDKNGKTSDREMEALSVMGLDKTMTELSRPRADAMKSKNIMYNNINNTGQVSLEDIPIDIDDSLAKNLLNTYLVGSLLNTNLINQDYYLPYTLKNKKKQISRV
jgi:hypothetical protein